MMTINKGKKEELGKKKKKKSRKMEWKQAIQDHMLAPKNPMAIDQKHTPKRHAMLRNTENRNKSFRHIYKQMEQA